MVSVGDGYFLPNQRENSMSRPGRNLIDPGVKRAVKTQCNLGGVGGAMERDKAEIENL